MVRSAAPLRIVQAIIQQPDPDVELAALFAEEADHLRELKRINADLYAARDRYAAKHGLGLMLPGIDRLRTLFGRTS